MKKYISAIFVLLLLNCCQEQETEVQKPEFRISEILYENSDDIARASFNSSTNEYVLFFHRKDDSGDRIFDGPFIYKVLNKDFKEIRSGEFGSERSDNNDVWFFMKILPLADTVLRGIHEVLQDGKI
ncbi:hypothetical protein, partial [Tunicatimonas sp.]|uniref:hypothetical protein n=1 Tax=Tunicatimonas sp. TaxID=1940096 RepID=UPI003C768602